MLKKWFHIAASRSNHVICVDSLPIAYATSLGSGVGNGVLLTTFSRRWGYSAPPYSGGDAMASACWVCKLMSSKLPSDLNRKWKLPDLTSLRLILLWRCWRAFSLDFLDTSLDSLLALIAVRVRSFSVTLEMAWFMHITDCWVGIVGMRGSSSMSGRSNTLLSPDLIPDFTSYCPLVSLDSFIHKLNLSLLVALRPPPNKESRNSESPVDERQGW